MAQKKEGAPTSNPTQSDEMQMPAEFQRRTSVDDAPWFHLAKGNVCYGRLIDRFVMKTTPVRAYYQVELKKPAQVRIGSGEEAEVVEAKAGQIVNLNESVKIKFLAEKEIPEIRAGAAYDVFIKVGDKRKIGSGRTMWEIDGGSHMVRPPTGDVRPLLPDAPASDDSSAGDSDGF